MNRLEELEYEIRRQKSEIRQKEDWLDQLQLEYERELEKLTKSREAAFAAKQS